MTKISRTIWVGLALAAAIWAQPSRHFRFRFDDDFHEVALDGRTRQQMASAGRPSKNEPYLGIEIRHHKTEDGLIGCLVRGVRPGPILEAGLLREDDLLLAINGVDLDSTSTFWLQLEKQAPGSEVQLRVRRAEKKGAETIAARVASRAEWAAPVDWIRPANRRVNPDALLPGVSRPTEFEQFINSHLDREKIRRPVDKLRNYLVATMESAYSQNMLDRVAYGFYRPSRLPELQTSITGPLARIGDNAKRAPLEAWQPVLEQAARNLDHPFTAAPAAAIDFSNPSQTLAGLSARVATAYSHLERAFAKLDATRQVELEQTLPQLLIDRNWTTRPFIRAGQASLEIDYSSLFAAAASLVAWTAARDPTPGPGHSPVALPPALAGAVTGDVLAVERIGGRWYVYGGAGRNEYDLSRIDVVVDAGGDDTYRYPSNLRPRIQLVIDQAGNDRYFGEKDAAGPASAMLGVSIVIDGQGNDHYEGGLRSCGVGVMGIGLILDVNGDDTYQGTQWSIGAGYYGFGGVVDLDGGDVYLAQRYSQAIGGPRGFGLILDVRGNDLYRANGPVPSGYGDPGVYSAFSQGIGIGCWFPWTGGFDTGGIGVLADLGGDDRYEVGEYGQGVGFYFGMGILYDRDGRDLYYGGRYGQAASAHGGIGILADDAGDDTYWGTIADAWDLSLAMLIDRGGNDSYQGYQSRGGGLGTGEQQSIAFLIDLDGRDRYDLGPKGALRPSPATPRAQQAAAYEASGMGESSAHEYNYKLCVCHSLSVLLDAGGTPDFYSRTDRGDGLTISTGKENPVLPEFSNVYGLFIDSADNGLGPRLFPLRDSPLAVASPPPATYVGQYALSNGVIFSVTLDRDRLSIWTPQDGKAEMRIDTYDNFSIPGGDRVEFRRNWVGQVHSLILRRAGRQLTATRK
ncbi:MAG: PDZ domain-containing protein [Bryobacterales bacterium]|nr:PDZ domain-containing protein [Bryobacterales bacterium]